MSNESSTHGVISMVLAALLFILLVSSMLLSGQSIDALFLAEATPEITPDVTP